MGFGICKANNTHKTIIIKEDFSNQPDIKESNEPMTINEIKNFKHIEPMSKKEIKDLYSNQPSMCKINFQKEKDGKIFNSSGTGFFMKSMMIIFLLKRHYLLIIMYSIKIV